MGSYFFYADIDGKEIPFKVHVEKRTSVRVSFGRDHINLRLPVYLSEGKRNGHIERAKDWVRKQVAKKPHALDQYILKDYDTIPHIDIYDTRLGIDISYSDRKTGKADYSKADNTIHMVLPLDLDTLAKDKMIKQLLSRICAQLFQKDIENRVKEINDKCFHKEIKSVNLKYNKSNWGSCSTNLNINLSTRLLFAPKPVIDYVIVHELAHLYEMNHSAKYWNIVSQVMPDYKEKEKWLTTHGAGCDF